ncbi:hypothetical protein F4824DRAFT_15296 [Ustulina deusta]|nr:hypothetical protein F4824DRAFT_15296 [Ustulina deusta]
MSHRIGSPVLEQARLVYSALPTWHATGRHFHSKAEPGDGWKLDNMYLADQLVLQPHLHLVNGLVATVDVQPLRGLANFPIACSRQCAKWAERRPHASSSRRSALAATHAGTRSEVLPEASWRGRFMPGWCHRLGTVEHFSSVARRKIRPAGFGVLIYLFLFLIFFFLKEVKSTKTK